MVYLNDVAIFFKSTKEHLQQVESTMQLLQKTGVTFKLE